MKELIGVCKECLGCNKLENPLFTGVKECEYATVEQLQIEQMMIGGIPNVNKQQSKTELEEKGS